MTVDGSPRGALDGLRVIDLTAMLAGPWCTMLLADQGADVIKVEPVTGDATRLMGPFAADQEGPPTYGGYFQSINRGKRSICIDLKTEAGASLLKQLVANADVLVENYRVGVMDKLGLGYERLRDVNRKLVYAAIRGFGDPRTGRSPYAHWPAYDVVAQATGGIMSITGPKGTPMKVGPGVGDTMPAALTAFGILAAVYRANRTGEGQFVDVAMADAVLAFCERIVYQHSYTGEVPVPEGNAHPMLCPFGLFPVRDGHVAIACPSDQFWALLATAMDRPDMIVDDKYRTNARRVARNAEVVDIVSQWTARHTKSELVAMLGGSVPFGPVNDVTDIFADPHARAREMLVAVEHPGLARRVTIAGTPVKMTGTPGRVHRRAPTVGEHSDEILRGIGYADADIANLRRSGVIV